MLQNLVDLSFGGLCVARQFTGPKQSGGDFADCVHRWC